MLVEDAKGSPLRPHGRLNVLSHGWPESFQHPLEAGAQAPKLNQSGLSVGGPWLPSAPACNTTSPAT